MLRTQDQAYLLTVSQLYIQFVHVELTPWQRFLQSKIGGKITAHKKASDRQGFCVMIMFLYLSLESE